MSDWDGWQATAVHEAGHAVAGVRLGFAVARVWAAGPDRGRCEYEVPAGLPDDRAGWPARWLRRELVFTLAGFAAEADRFPGAGSGLLGSDDLAAASALAKVLGGDPASADRVFQDGMRRAVKLVRDERLMIGQVAGAMLKAPGGTLTGDEVRRIAGFW